MAERVIIVSNRLPVTVRTREGQVEVVRSMGGLATGLAGPHQERGGLWIGWPGDTTDLAEAQRRDVERQLGEQRLVPVHLTRDEVAGYYEGFSNRVLWPLFHYLVDHVPLEAMQWEVYRRVNERFAEEIARHVRPGDRVWIHDYQLCLVPAMLRERTPGVRIGFFLHIPFPAAEVIQALPWRNTLVRGLLGADLIGFHTWRYQRHFADTVHRLLGFECEPQRCVVDGRVVRLGAYPMGIDARAFADLAATPEVRAKVEQLKQEAHGARILLGIDRLDYTKGIRRRLLALERLLDRDPSLHGTVKFVQIAVPSRTGIAEYEEFRQDVDEVVGRLNGAHGTTGWVPVHYLYRALSMPELVALYCAADVMLVTPLRDGMNLVAKEFAASRVDERGVLLLSELAGASAELPDALRVNPYDVDDVGDALLRALQLSPAEQARRMRTMRGRVLGWDVHRWVRSFLEDLDADARLPPAIQVSPAVEQEAILRHLAGAPERLLLLDVDGTLVPFAATPKQAGPDPELRALLEALSTLPNTHVHLVSGRPRHTLEAWFGALPVGLHAEHGLWARDEQGQWTPGLEVNDAWKAQVLPRLERLAWRTPGAFVEEKTASVAWHYRRADPDHGEANAELLVEELAPIARRLRLDILQGDRVVELRQHGAHKGLAVARALAAVNRGVAVLAMGDDRTDEDLFAALPTGAIAVHVGPRPSQAPYRLRDVREARRLLARLVDETLGREEAGAASDTVC